jgi:YgiT-type zinc finger domain-containing protein
MNCHICGAQLQEVITDLPFKVDDSSIVIIKDLPVLQCRKCSEYLLKDQVLERLDIILKKLDKAAELEIIRYAA